MDWTSRKVLFWRLSNSLDVSFCIEAMVEAITHNGTPGIFNTDQWSQFTSLDFTNILIYYNSRISTVGQNRWRGNIIY
jgi:putative transposase